MPRTLVIGIGNPLQGADAFGPAVVGRLRARRDLPDTVDLEDGDTDLLASLDRFASFEHVVLVDAVLGDGTGGVVAIDEQTFSTWSLDSPGVHELSPVLVVRLFRRLYPASRARFTLVGLDVQQIDGMPLPAHLADDGADAVLRVCACRCQRRIQSGSGSLPG